MIIQKLQNLNIQNNTQRRQVNFTSLPQLGSDMFEATTKFSQKYLDAKKYLNIEQWGKNIMGHTLDIYDMEKLDGIQEGIKVFEGLSMKEIKLVFSDLEGILLSRGCRNNCSHCCESAQVPPSKVKEKLTNTISTIAWEDFLSITSGIKELSNRLGFNVNSRHESFIPFIDSDPINFKSFDKNGKPHNIAEAIKILDETLNLKSKNAHILFDTSGWFKSDEWSRKAAQDLAKLAEENPRIFYQFNVSINPFHGIINRSTELAKQGNTNSSKKLRELYTDRMAEVLMTFSPVVKAFDEKWHIDNRFVRLYRYAPNQENNSGYSRYELNNIYEEIFTKYDNQYKNLALKKQKELRVAYNYFKELPFTLNGLIVQLGRGEKYFTSPQRAKSFINNRELLNYSNKYIDINGNVIFEDENTIRNRARSDIQFNYANKYKSTPSLNFTNINNHLGQEFIDRNYH